MHTGVITPPGEAPSQVFVRCLATIPMQEESVTRVAVGADVRPVRQARPLVADGLQAPLA